MMAKIDTTNGDSSLPLEPKLQGEETFTTRNIVYASLISLFLILGDQYSKGNLNFFDNKAKIENLSPKSISLIDQYGFNISPEQKKLDIDITLHQGEGPMVEREYLVSIVKSFDKFNATIDTDQLTDTDLGVLFEKIQQYIVAHTPPLEPSELNDLSVKLNAGEEVAKDMNRNVTISTASN